MSADAGERADRVAGFGGITCIKEGRAGAIAAVGLIGADLADRMFKASEAADLLDFLSLPDGLEALCSEVSERRDQVHARIDLAVATDDDTGATRAAHAAVWGGGSGFELFGKRGIAFGHEVVEVGEFVGLDLHGERVALAVVGGGHFEVDDKTRAKALCEGACGDELAEVVLHLQEFDFGF